MLKVVLILALIGAVVGSTSPVHNRSAWKAWIADFGHDVYLFPSFLTEEAAGCKCVKRLNAYTCKDNDKT